MYKIVSKRFLANDIYLMDIEAPRVAKSAQPGQFIIVKNNEKGERIPLTVADYDREKGTVTIVFQTVGASTKELSTYEVGEYVSDFVGPLGQPSEFIHENIEELKHKNIVFIAGGVGTAPVYPQVKWFNEQGIKVDVIVGARNKELLILTDEMEKVAGNLYIATDDGSEGFNGRVTDCLDNLINSEGKKYDHAVVIGPMIMMKFMALKTKEHGIETTVSLNPIMVDGTGMCGACRVTVGNEVKFACVDGPEFDGHLVNFDESMRRQALYKSAEGRAVLKTEEGTTHKRSGCNCKEEV